MLFKFAYFFEHLCLYISCFIVSIIVLIICLLSDYLHALTHLFTKVPWKLSTHLKNTLGMLNLSEKSFA